MFNIRFLINQKFVDCFQFLLLDHSFLISNLKFCHNSRETRESRNKKFLNHNRIMFESWHYKLYVI